MPVITRSQKNNVRKLQRIIDSVSTENDMLKERCTQLEQQRIDLSITNDKLRYTVVSSQERCRELKRHRAELEAREKEHQELVENLSIEKDALQERCNNIEKHRTQLIQALVERMSHGTNLKINHGKNLFKKTRRDNLVLGWNYF